MKRFSLFCPNTSADAISATVLQRLLPRVIGTGTLVRYLSRISGTCPYDSLDLLIQKCYCYFVILLKLRLLGVEDDNSGNRQNVI